jgi:hypothetical protein
MLRLFEETWEETRCSRRLPKPRRFKAASEKCLIHDLLQKLYWPPVVVKQEEKIDEVEKE